MFSWASLLTLWSQLEVLGLRLAGPRETRSSRHKAFPCGEALVRTFAVSWHGFTTLLWTFRNTSPCSRLQLFLTLPSSCWSTAKQFGVGMDKKVTEGPGAITQSLFLQIVKNGISNLNQSFVFSGFFSCTGIAVGATFLPNTWARMVVTMSIPAATSRFFYRPW